MKAKPPLSILYEQVIPGYVVCSKAGGSAVRMSAITLAGDSESACTSSDTGTVRFNHVDKKLQLCVDGAWVPETL